MLPGAVTHSYSADAQDPGKAAVLLACRFAGAIGRTAPDQDDLHASLSGMAWPDGEQGGLLAAINAGTCGRSRISQR
jgi:hypothetical protein